MKQRVVRVGVVVAVLSARVVVGSAQSITDQLSAIQSTLTTLSQQVTTLKATVAGTPAPAPTPVPTPTPTPTLTYTSISDTVARPRPAAPALGPAGFVLTDPDFHNTIIRVTDRTTNGGSSLRVASNAHLTEWNADGSKFYAVDEGGGVHLFAFDGVAKITPLATSVPGSNVEPSFSYADPNLLYVVSGPNTRTLMTLNIATGVKATLYDVDANNPGVALANTYIGAVVLGDSSWVLCFGGGGQDSHYLVHHSGGRTLNTQQQPKPFHVHSISIDRTGQYVLVYPTSPDLATGIAQVQIWDTTANTVTPVTNLPGGHDSAGYGDWINQDCCTSGSWDALRWQYRKLPTPSQTKDLIPVPLTPKEISLDDHSNWRADQPNASIPFVSSTFRYAAGITTTWRAWDDEILAVAVDGSGKVWRFCHHFSDLTSGDFWSQPIVNVSPNGRWAIFTSNWMNTLGGTATAPKQDVFLVHLN